MSESNYFEVPCQRNVAGPNFSQGVQDYTFSIGAPNCWTPSKSFFRVEMTLTAAAAAAGFVPPISAGTPLKPSLLTAFADNAVGNLFDNTYMRAGQQDISSVVQYAAQASALDIRLNNTLPWLQSMGSSTAINEASFLKRLNQITANPGNAALSTPQITRINSYGNREIYRPVAAGANTFGLAQVAIAAPLAAGAGSIVTGSAGAAFTLGMPSVDANGFPSNTGGSVATGDILVVRGVEYEISAVGGPTALTLNQIAPATVATNDWFIVRGDSIRDKQATSSVYSLWQPPIGIFKYSEELGAGDYRIQLNPNSNFNLNAVECRNPSFATASPYQLTINDIRFYCYVEKKSIPDTVRDLYLNEMLVQSKPYSSNLQFSVPPSTSALTIFFQDGDSGSNPLVPPSMFKVKENTDLLLKNIQLTYANITKPSTNWSSEYKVAQTLDVDGFNPVTSVGVNKLEQRYHDSYEESGMDIKSCGCETFYDWLQRGGFYHYSFERDVNNKSTEVQLNLVFLPNAVIPNTMRVFIVSHYRKTVQITTANGLVVNVSTREV